MIKSSRKIEKIRKQIAAMDVVAHGTISKRTKVCGRPNCRCAKDDDARHGPYFEWTRREKGRYAHSIISPEQAKELARAINNHKKLQGLLKQWSKETARLLKM